MWVMFGMWVMLIAWYVGNFRYGLVPFEFFIANKCHKP